MCDRRDRERIETLTNWFRSAHRDLPWRRQRDGYTALVAEAMLQQTQVARVVQKFETFIDRFPTVDSLAAATEQDVLAAWQGLGYYRRARHLHAAARKIVDEFDGSIPANVKALQQLPGVGRYTAGAIASIVFDRPVPIVDGNVQRVLARWSGDARHAERRDLDWSWKRAEQLAKHATAPGEFNEAMMELGAVVCTPKSPRCHACPVAELCVANRDNLQDQIPPPKTRIARKRVHHHAVVIERGDSILLEQRPSNGLWSNMWQPPTVESDNALSEAQVFNDLELRCSSIESVAEFDHQTTHRRVTFHVYRAATRRRSGLWQPIDALHERPLSNAHHKVIALGLAPHATVLHDA